MLELDGSAGGGQLLRSALTCALATGEGFELAGVRGDRPTPGLGAQHLAAVEFAAEVADATVRGAALESETLAFDPGTVRPGEYGGSYEVDVGTAGSLTLLCDVALPLAPALDAPLELTASGGTDVPWSPPADFHREIKLPLLDAAGWRADLDVARRGFYPLGEGEVTLSLAPYDPSPLDLASRGDRDGAQVYAVESEHLTGADVGARLADETAAGLRAAGWTVDTRVETVESASPGAVVVARLDYEGGVAGVSALGEKGVPAEEVAAEAVSRAADADEAPGAVDRHLADQLVLPVALVGGRVSIPEVTAHVETCVDLVRAFGLDVRLERRNRGAVLRGDGARTAGRGRGRGRG